MKICSILLMLFMVLCLCSCGPKVDVVRELSTPTSSITEKLTIPKITPEELPKPEEIIPMDDPGGLLDFDEEPNYRVVYYGMSGAIGELGEFCPPYDAKSNEMEMINYIKYNNIIKMDFLVAIQKEYAWSINNRKDITLEENELPNPDIIYTFDNEIINAYYRRENPVEPDWSKIKTYDSYSAYLEAQR